MVLALYHLEVDGKMTLSLRSLFIDDLVEGSLPSHYFLAVLATRWAVRSPSFTVNLGHQQHVNCHAIISQDWRDKWMTCACYYRSTQETELMTTQHPNTARPIALIVQAQQHLDPATTESILYCSVTVQAGPAETVPVELPQWAVGFKLWEAQVLRF